MGGSYWKRDVSQHFLLSAKARTLSLASVARMAEDEARATYKTAFVLAHKMREAMAAEHKGAVLNGHVEIDGAYFGGHVRPENRKADRKDRRLAEHQTGKRRCVVVMREHGGR